MTHATERNRFRTANESVLTRVSIALSAWHSHCLTMPNAEHGMRGGEP
jgi:hypothetical protein